MISVVIPAYNEEKLIGSCLEAFLHQTTTKPFEIILVDNNSLDKTVTIAQSYGKRLPLRIFREKRKGRGTARATGFQHANGDIILSTDADIIVPSDWIENMTDALHKHTVEAITGTCQIQDQSKVVNIIFNHFWQPAGERMYRFLKGHWCLMGYNFAIRKSVYQKIGAFNAQLNCEEDADLSERVAKMGKIDRLPIAVIQSGRRFQAGIIRGSWPYICNFIRTPFVKREQFILQDIR